MFTYASALGRAFEEASERVERNSVAVNAEFTNECRIKELEKRIERLSLLNQGLWELLRDRLGLADADLENAAYAVDMRDGIQDGKISTSGMRCPKCNRVSNAHHGQRLYCGQRFETPLFG
jgi:ribosomal protein S27AE